MISAPSGIRPPAKAPPTTDTDTLGAIDFAVTRRVSAKGSLTYSMPLLMTLARPSIQRNERLRTQILKHEVHYWTGSVAQSGNQGHSGWLV
uniref:Uncharacterized protein n=1 Tax=Glossina brevipalpis TaxID=37001 RepID=A0A1A9WGC5_9MUSC